MAPADYEDAHNVEDEEAEIHKVDGLESVLAKVLDQVAMVGPKWHVKHQAAIQGQRRQTLQA